MDSDDEVGVMADWKKLLKYCAGDLEEELRKQNEYLMNENRIFRGKIPGRIRFTDAERIILAEKGKALGKLLGDTVTIVQPETILKWYRQLIAKKFDTSHSQKQRGRPGTDSEVEQLILKIAKENSGWGYDRIAGALHNLGYKISDQTIGNLLKRNGLGPSPERERATTWSQFIKRHRDVLWATDFFTTEVWSMGGLVTFYVLFFIHLQSRKIVLGGITRHPDEEWMKQVARNISSCDGELEKATYLIHDRDTKYTNSFDHILKTANIKPLKLPPKSPNLNAYAERFVRSIKEECLDKFILFGEKSLRYVVKEYVAHYHAERNHQGIDNAIPFPDDRLKLKTGTVTKSERLGGMLNYYYRKAA